MSSQFGVEKSGGEGAETVGATAVISTISSEIALDLKSSPKQTCIPLHQRQRLVSSETSVNSKKLDIDMPDKSWSVLYIGAKKEDSFDEQRIVETNE
ncbi:hypothetical protein KR215_001092 [Drosophila sulfurigaster]|uniref:Uncharacterized protein LOC117568416 isoform X2 n=1 Tax=Drosophila albomicans TaxID=7291 RepID=A0A6P8YA01_DROAB|nr:uncharacterized protein LOC117568416 isoform X2 [Drosophila albomicans]XP_062130349.1 uncharacterized protein LOC133841692 [Drosophila sulfurigaster albostrigata]KAH8390476.1 hypothetical protein KR215_001092 [Drosophila sulfurigaster]